MPPLSYKTTLNSLLQVGSNYRHYSDVDPVWNIWNLFHTIYSCFNRFCRCYKHPNHPSPISEELLQKLLQLPCGKKGESTPLCVQPVSVAIILHYEVWYLHTVHILHQGIFWNHQEVLELRDHFRKREGVHLKEEGWRQHLYEGRVHHIAAFLVRWSFLIRFKDLATAISLKMEELSLFFSQAVQVTTSVLQLCLPPDIPSISCPPDWAFSVHTEISDIWVYRELSYWAISFQL